MDRWIMRSKDFYEILEEKQQYRCALTGWELTPQNTRISHIVPLREGGKHEKSNVQLIHEVVATLAREQSKEKLYQICCSVVEHLRFKYE